MYRYLLFDLDGTLTDSKEGIVNCLKYALEKMDRPCPPEEMLSRFVGPPLQDTLMKYCGFTREETVEGIRWFRRRYNTVGKFENAPVEGIADMLRRLKERGCRLALASSKPEPQCIEICDKFGFTPYLEATVGSPAVGGDWTKADVVREAIRRLGLSDADKPSVLMVGDRKYDVQGAAACGVACLGVEFFGYAEEGELAEAGAAAVVHTVEQLEDFILKH